MDTYLDDNGNFDVKRWAAWAEKRGYLPWQMTLAEYSQFLDRDRKPLDELRAKHSLHTIALIESERLSIKRSAMEQHQRSVLHALESGKDVRPEVLADYNLAPKAAA